MFIVDINGGLGNQMYQYALFRALQEKGEDAKLSVVRYANIKKNKNTRIVQHGRNFLLEDIFNVKVSYADPNLIYKLGTVKTDFFSKVFRKLGLYKKTHIRETAYNYPKMEKLLSFNNAFLDGYWQDFSYSKDIEQKLREEFTFKVPLTDKNLEVSEKIKNCNAVSIHIRRNDYLNVPMYKIQESDYFFSAIKYINEKVENPVFFCFSDDIQWCKNTFKEHDMIFVDWNTGTDSYRDMQLMSMCKHNIVTNSTFSVWAAWLNNNPQKIVIRPENYYNDAYSHIKFIWPKEWNSESNLCITKQI